MSDFNRKVIREFRANAGRVGGVFEGMTLLLLHNRGAKTGLVRINPLATLKVGDEQIIAASNGGADTHPDWFHNLAANPDVIVELGEDKFTAVAEITQEPERTSLFNRLKEAYPGFAKYEAGTSRVIPVIKLKRE